MYLLDTRCVSVAAGIQLSELQKISVHRGAAACWWAFSYTFFFLFLFLSIPALWIGQSVYAVQFSRLSAALVSLMQWAPLPWHRFDWTSMRLYSANKYTLAYQATNATNNQRALIFTLFTIKTGSDRHFMGLSLFSFRSLSHAHPSIKSRIMAQMIAIGGQHVKHLLVFKSVI